jgi:exosortase E/protease (VPEID-CTERM system)
MLAILDRPVFRWLFFFALLLIEIIALTTSYEVPSPQYYFVAKTDAAWLFEFSKQYWRLMLWIIGACLLMVTPYYKAIFSDFVLLSNRYRWHVWFSFHIVSLAIFVVVTALLFKQPADPTRLTTAWFSIWAVIAGATFTLWLLALAPAKFWLRVIRDNRMELLAGILLGICAWILIGMLARQEAPLAQKELWSYLSRLTLQIVYFLLSWVYPDLIYQPESSVVGTATFPVQVTYACSGIEGVSMIIVFLAVYLWLFRKNLRFPQVLWLFPLGILAIWLANAIRIALLVAIGSSFSPEVAGVGFHAQAGWIAFTLISLAAITLTHRMSFFTSNVSQPTNTIVSDPLAAALLAPLLVQMAALMITSAFSGGFDWLYPVRIGIVTVVLCYFRKIYSRLVRTWSWQAPAIGTLVFIVWMVLEPSDQGSGAALLQGLEKLPSGWGAVWLVSRVFGSVIVVPLAEELAFRSYLIRKLIAKDFENVPNGRFSWLSFLLSSLLFGLLHDRWFAGTLAGMGYALALYRRGHLGDAVIAHMTTNALIAILVLTQGRWALWG